ncbi:hypothetical protein [Chitinimonas naiadis]
MDRREKDPWQKHIEDEIAAIKGSINAIDGTTTQVKEILDAMRGGFKVLGWLGVAAKWVTPFVMLFGAVYTVWLQVKTGHK